MKRLLLLMLISKIFAYSWAYDFKSGDLYYNITSNSAPYTVEVTYSSTSRPSSDDDVNYANLITANIPAFVSYGGKTYNVTSIGFFAFSMCSSLTSITIPNNALGIGDYAFTECSSLESVTIGKSVNTIGARAFANCSSLRSIIIPDKVTIIKDETFRSCTSLHSVSIGKNVTSIEPSAFQNCSSLTSITIPNNVIKIGYSAFEGCKSLQSLIIGKNVTTIGRAAFSSCSSLIAVIIPSSVTTIENYVFAGCSSLISMVVESGNTILDSRNNCNAIIETSTNTLISGCNYTSIPEDVITIGSGAFWGCITLVNTITIPKNVKKIETGAFGGLTSLTSIYIKAETPPTLGNLIFSGYAGVNFPPICHIPCGTLTAYQKSDWNDCVSRFIEECQDLLIIPYEATSLTIEERKSNPNHIIYPATLEDKDSVEMRCN